MADTLTAPDGADPETRLVAALWQVVAAHGWQGLTLRRVADAAGLPMADLRRLCPDRLDLLRLHAGAMDRAVQDAAAASQAASARDRVLDALMARIDAMQPHRAGILRLAAEARRDPLLGLLLLRALPGAVGWMRGPAEAESAGVAGIAGVWLATLRAWVGDDSVDLGPTMAALDRALHRAEQVATSLRLGPRG